MRLLPSDPYHHQPNTMHYALHLISAHQVAIAFWVADKKYITHKYNHATHIPHISKHSVHSHQLDLLDLAKLVRKQFAIKVILSVMGLQHARKLLAHSSCCLWPTYHHIYTLVILPLNGSAHELLVCLTYRIHLTQCTVEEANCGGWTKWRIYRLYVSRLTKKGGRMFRNRFVRSTMVRVSQMNVGWKIVFALYANVWGQRCCYKDGSMPGGNQLVLCQSKIER